MASAILVICVVIENSRVANIFDIIIGHVRRTMIRQGNITEQLEQSMFIQPTIAYCRAENISAAAAAAAVQPNPQRED